MAGNLQNALGQVVLFGVFNLPDELVESEETTMSRLLSPSNVNISAPDHNQVITVTYNTVLDGEVVRRYTLAEWCNIIGRLGEKEGLSDKRMHSLCCIPMVNRARSLAGLPEEPIPSNPIQEDRTVDPSVDDQASTASVQASVNVAEVETPAKFADESDSPEENKLGTVTGDVSKASPLKSPEEGEASCISQENDGDGDYASVKEENRPLSPLNQSDIQSTQVPEPPFTEKDQKVPISPQPKVVNQQRTQENLHDETGQSTPQHQLADTDEDMPALELHEPTLQNDMSPLQAPQQSDDDTEPPHLSPAHIQEKEQPVVEQKGKRSKKRAHSSAERRQEGGVGLPIVDSEKVRVWAFETAARNPCARPPNDKEIQRAVEESTESPKTPTSEINGERQLNSEKKKKKKKKNKRKHREGRSSESESDNSKRKRTSSPLQENHLPQKENHELKIRIKKHGTTAEIVKNSLQNEEQEVDGSDQQMLNKDVEMDDDDPEESDRLDGDFDMMHSDEEMLQCPNSTPESNIPEEEEVKTPVPPPKLSWEDIAAWEYWQRVGMEIIKKKKQTLTAEKKLELITATKPLLKTFYQHWRSWVKRTAMVNPDESDHRDALTCTYAKELNDHYENARAQKTGLSSPLKALEKLGEIEIIGYKALHPISSFMLPVETQPHLMSRIKNYKMLHLGQIVWALWKKNEWWPASIANFVKNPKSDMPDITVLWVNEKTYNDRPYHHVLPFDYAFHMKYNPKNSNVKYQQAVAKAILINGYVGFWEPFMGPYLFREMANDTEFHGMLAHLPNDVLRDFLDLRTDGQPSTWKELAKVTTNKKKPSNSKTSTEQILNEMLLENTLVKLFIMKRRSFPKGTFFAATWEMYPEFLESSYCPPPPRENAFGNLELDHKHLELDHEEVNRQPEYEEVNYKQEFEEDDVKPDVSTIDTTNKVAAPQQKLEWSISRKEIEDRQREDEANGIAAPPPAPASEIVERSSFDQEIENAFEEQKKHARIHGRITAAQMQTTSTSSRGSGGNRRNMLSSVQYGPLCREPFPGLPGEDKDDQKLYDEVHGIN